MYKYFFGKGWEDELKKRLTSAKVGVGVEVEAVLGNWRGFGSQAAQLPVKQENERMR